MWKALLIFTKMLTGIAIIVPLSFRRKKKKSSNNDEVCCDIVTETKKHGRLTMEAKKKIRKTYSIFPRDHALLFSSCSHNSTFTDT